LNHWTSEPRERLPLCLAISLALPVRRGTMFVMKHESIDSPAVGPHPIRIGPEAITRLRLMFTADYTTSEVCDTLENLELALSPEDASCVRYALVEVVANALRTSAEKKVPEPTCVEMWCDGGRLRFKVSDSAGGFDLGLLPYDFFDPDADIDLESETFERYRQAYQETRFGLGLILARRAVDEFRLYFVDHDGRATTWAGDGSVKGTIVTFSKKITGGGHDRG